MSQNELPLDGFLAPCQSVGEYHILSAVVCCMHDLLAGQDEASTSTSVFEGAPSWVGSIF